MNKRTVLQIAKDYLEMPSQDIEPSLRALAKAYVKLQEENNEALKLCRDLLALCKEADEQIDTLDRIPWWVRMWMWKIEDVEE